MRGDYRFRKVSRGKLFLAARIHQNINPATNQIALELNNTLKSKKVTVRCLMINCRVNNKLVSFQSSPTTYEGDHEAVEKLFLSAENAKKAQLQQGQKK